MPETIRIKHGETVELWGRKVTLSIENCRQGAGPVTRLANIEVLDGDTAPSEKPAAPDKSPPSKSAGDLVVSVVEA